MNSSDLDRNSIIAELEEVLNQNSSGASSQYEIFRNTEEKAEIISSECLNYLKEFGLSSFSHSNDNTSSIKKETAGKSHDLSTQLENFLQQISEFDGIDWLMTEEFGEEGDHSDHFSEGGDATSPREKIAAVKLVTSPFQLMIDSLRGGTSPLQQILPALSVVSSVQRTKRVGYKSTRKDRRRERRDTSNDQQSGTKHGAKSKFFRKRDKATDVEKDESQANSENDLRRKMESLSVCVAKALAEGSDVSLLTAFAVLLFEIRDVDWSRVNSFSLPIGGLLGACFDRNLSKSGIYPVSNPFEAFAHLNIATSKRTRSNSITNSEISRHHFAASSDGGDETLSRDDNTSQAGHFGGGTSDAGSSTMGGGSSVFTHSIGAENSLILRDDLNEEDMLAQAIALSMGEASVLEPSTSDNPSHATITASLNESCRMEEEDMEEREIDPTFINEAEETFGTTKPLPHPFTALAPFTCVNLWKASASLTTVAGISSLSNFQNTHAVPIRSAICSLLSLVLTSVVEIPKGDGCDHLDPNAESLLNCMRVSVSTSLSSQMENLALLEFCIGQIKQLMIIHLEVAVSKVMRDNGEILAWFTHLYFLSWSLNSLIRLVTEILSSFKEVPTTSFASSVLKAIKTQLLDLAGVRSIGPGASSELFQAFTGALSSEKSFFHRVKQTSTETLNQLIEREGVDATLIDANLSPWSFLHCLRLSALRGLAVVSQLSANLQQRLETVKMTLCALVNEEAGSLQCYSLEEISSFVTSQLQAKLQISAVVPLNNEILFHENHYNCYFLHYLCINLLKFEPVFSNRPDNVRTSDNAVLFQNQQLIQTLLFAFLRRSSETKMAAIPSPSVKYLVGEYLLLLNLQKVLFRCSQNELDNAVSKHLRKRSILLQFNPVRSHTSLVTSQDSTVVHHLGPKVWASVVSQRGFPSNSGIYEIVLRVDRCSKGHVFLGLATEDFVCEKDSYVGVDRHSWGLIGTRSLWHNKSKIVSDYGPGFTSNSIIILRYDSNKGLVTFRSALTSSAVSGEDSASPEWGKAFDNLPKKPLFLACSLHEKGDKVTFLSCTNFPSSNGSSKVSSNLPTSEEEEDSFSIETDGDAFRKDSLCSVDPQIANAPKSQWLRALLDYGKILLSTAHNRVSTEKDDSSYPLISWALPSFLAHLLGFPPFLISETTEERILLTSTFLPTLISSFQSLKSTAPNSRLQQIQSEGLWDIKVPGVTNNSSISEVFQLRISKSDSDLSEVEEGKKYGIYAVEIHRDQSNSAPLLTSSSLSNLIGIQNWNYLNIYEGSSPRGLTLMFQLRLSLCGSHLYGIYFDKSDRVCRVQGSFNYGVKSVRKHSALQNQEILFRLAVLYAATASRLSSGLIRTSSTVSDPTGDNVPVPANLLKNDSDDDEEGRDGDPANEEIDLSAPEKAEVDSSTRKMSRLDRRWLKSDLFSGGLKLSVEQQEQRLFLCLNELFSPYSVSKELLERKTDSFIPPRTQLRPRQEEDFIRLQFDKWMKSCFAVGITLPADDLQRNHQTDMEIFLSNLLHSKGNTQILDDYIFLHIGSSMIVKSQVGGATLSYLRKAVLVSLIRHSGVFPTCSAIFSDLAKNTREITERPPQILCDVWRASIKVLESVVRLKQETGAAYEVLCHTIYARTELLDSLAMNDVACMILEDLQLLERSHLISDKWYIESWSLRSHCSKLINEIMEFLTAPSVNPNFLTRSLYDQNLISICRGIGYRSFLQLLDPEDNNLTSTPQTNFLNLAVLQYLPDQRNVSFETGDMIDSISPQNQTMHYAHDLQATSKFARTSLRIAFEKLYSTLTRLLARSTWQKDRPLQALCLLSWNIIIEPTEHVFLNHVDLFRVLNSVLDDLRATSSSLRGTDSFATQVLFQTCQLECRSVSRIALTTVYSLAAQIAATGDLSEEKKAFLQYGLRKSPSGPDTLSRSLFDLVYSELFTAVKQVSTFTYPEEEENEDETQSTETIQSKQNQMKEICEYIYRVLRLLGFVADSRICAKLLISPKWLSLFLAIIGIGSLEIQRRITRLLQKLLSSVEPSQLRAFVPNILVFNDLMRLELPVEDEDIADLMQSFDQSSENSTKAMVDFFLQNTLLSLNRSDLVSTEIGKGSSDLADAVSAETLYLLRTLLGIPVWRSFIFEIFLEKVVGSGIGSSNSNHETSLLAIVSVLGGSIEKRRVGGFVTIRPFALLGNADNLATKLAAASHSTGLLIGMVPGSSSAEVVLMERNSRVSFNAKQEITLSHTFNIAGSLPVRSIRLSNQDILPCSDVPFHPFQITHDLLKALVKIFDREILAVLSENGQWPDEFSEQKLFLHVLLVRSLSALLQHDHNVDILFSCLPVESSQKLFRIALLAANEFGLSGIESYTSKLVELLCQTGKKEVSSELNPNTRGFATKIPASSSSGGGGGGNNEAVFQQSPLRELASILSPFGRRSVDQGAQQAALTQMLEIGLPREWCEFALKRTNYNVEMAINLCLEHGSEMNQLIAQEAMLETARSQRESSSTSSAIRRVVPREGGIRREEREDPHNLIRQLLEMGFPPSWCARAMESTQNNLDAALGWILTHDEELLASNDSPGQKVEEDDKVSTEKCEEMEVGANPINPLTVISGCGQVKPDLTCLCTPNGAGFPSIGCRNYPVKAGKWYYELTVLTAGCVQVGWGDTSFTGNSDMGQGVGDDSSSWAYDGWRNYIWHETNAEWGGKWSPGDVVGCAIDLDERQILFSLNGCWDEIGMGIAFRDFYDPDANVGGFFPCVSFNKDEKVRFNFGEFAFAHNPPTGSLPFFHHINNHEKDSWNTILRCMPNTFAEQEVKRIEDSFEEFSLEKSSIQRRYFPQEEPKSVSNNDSINFFTTPAINSQDEKTLGESDNELHFTQDSRQLSRQLVILYCRLILLRIFKRVGKGEGSETSSAFFTSVFADRSEGHNPLGHLFQLLKIASFSTSRTKVYNYIMKILPPNYSIPGNVGPVLCVGGYPVLNELSSSMQLIFSSGISEMKLDAIEAATIEIARNTFLSINREFSSQWHFESIIPFIPRDYTLSESEELGKPSLLIAGWLTSLICLVLRNHLQISGDSHHTAFIFQCQKILSSLVSSWVLPLSSPILAIKGLSVKVLSSLLQESSYQWKMRNSLLRLATSELDWNQVISAFGRKRIEAQCIRFLRFEQSALHCSELLQTILELDAYLEHQELVQIGVDEEERKYSSLSLLLENEQDQQIPWHNWEAISGRCFIDADGWQTFSGFLKLESIILPHNQLSNARTLEKRDIPPTLLPGCKVCRRIGGGKLTEMSESSEPVSPNSSDKTLEETSNSFRIGTVEAIATWPNEEIRGTARIIRWDDDGETEMVRWGAEGVYDVIHCSLKNGKVHTRYSSPQTPWQRLSSKFGQETSFGFILRIRHGGDKLGPEAEMRCLLEWPDFCAVSCGTGKFNSKGELELVEEELLRGPSHSGWEARFGSSYWQAGTVFSLKYENQSVEDNYSVILSGQSEFQTQIYSRNFNVRGEVQLQQRHLFHFDERYRIPNVTLSIDRLSASKATNVGQGCAIGSVGFSNGVHYWEFKIEQAEIGSVFIGVTEKPTDVKNFRLSRWTGLGFVNNRSSYRVGEASALALTDRAQVYGDHFHSGDVVGVVLDLNRGKLSFFLDGMKYGEHILSDLGDAFDNLTTSDHVKPKTYFPIVGLSKALDRITLTPRWFSTIGSDAKEEMVLYRRVYQLFSTWNLDRSSDAPLQQHLWIYRDAWRHYLLWIKGNYVRVRARCKVTNLQFILDTSIEKCVEASIRLGLSKPLFVGDRIQFTKSSGRRLDVKEEAVILGCYSGNLWFRLEALSGSSGNQMEGGNNAWYLVPSDVEGFQLLKRAPTHSPSTLFLAESILPKIPRFFGGFVIVIHESGAVMRDGLEIDTSEVICTIPSNARVFAIEQRINASNIPRFFVLYEEKFGWISERMRGGSEETMLKLVHDVHEIEQAKSYILQHIPDEVIRSKVQQVECASLREALVVWKEKSLVHLSTQSSFSFRSCDLNTFIQLSSTTDGHSPWSVEADMQLAELISKCASQLNMDPYNMTIESFETNIRILQVNPHSALYNIALERLIARAAILRVANMFFAWTLPKLPLKLPEELSLLEATGQDCIVELLSTYQRRSNNKRNDSLSLDVFEYFEQPSSNQLDKFWNPPCFARRIRSLRRLLFTQTKLSFWESILNESTTLTALPQDEYEDPREIKTIRVNRIKATINHLAGIKNPFDRIKQSVFGQLHKEIRGWSSSNFRRSYVGKGHGGQKRAFKVKFIGEGVNDYGGPYRAVFEQVADELRVDTLTSSNNKIIERCLIPLLFPCPNRVVGAGLNQDNYILATGPTASPMNQELMSFLGKVVGLAVRHHLNMKLDLSHLVWRPLVRLPLTLAHLESVDNLSFRNLSSVKQLGTSLEQSEDIYPQNYQPEEWSDLTFTIYLADGTRVPLIPGGEQVPVNLSNWKEYVRLSEKSRLLESYVMYKALREGLTSVLPGELFSLFTSTEIEQLICGSGYIDVDLIRRYTEYEDLDPTSSLVENFWQVLSEMSDEERTLFLRFVWARSRMPSTKEFPVNFKLQKAQGIPSDQIDLHLPKAQTCFFSMSLPPYSSKEIMREKILYAIKNSPNMDADVRLHTAEGWGDS